jgi:branched-chain amino acid transport system substrate-binding protein
MAPNAPIRSIFVFALALMALIDTSCAKDAPAPEIRIGLLALLSGIPEETSGRPSVEGAELAVAQANEAGGIRIGGIRHSVKLIVKAYEDRPDSATSVARALVNQSQIDVLIGPQFSRHAIPVAIVAEDAEIPMVSPMSSSPGTTEGRRFVFRLASLDEVQARAMAEFAAGELGARRAAVLYDISTDYSRSLAESFRASFENRGGGVVAFESFTRDEPMEYRDRLSRIAASNPDVLYLPNDSERVEAQILQARERGVKATLLGGDTWDLERYLALPECDGAYVGHQWHPDLDTPEARRFRELFSRAYGKTPKITAAMTYDAIALVLSVIERKGSLDSSSIREGLAATRDFTGATGTIRFVDGPNPERKVVIARISRGKSELHRVVDLAGRAR